MTKESKHCHHPWKVSVIYPQQLKALTDMLKCSVIAADADLAKPCEDWSLCEISCASTVTLSLVSMENKSYLFGPPQSYLFGPSQSYLFGLLLTQLVKMHLLRIMVSLLLRS